ncbi:MAG: tyrosine-type recombinase/integrase [Beijerinckiaceae bacterium]|jgi:site-specific recombinase XerD|nr:tyrosine-type recombinase/integrase [Beijerinckiaceae bacterium]
MGAKHNAVDEAVDHINAYAIELAERGFATGTIAHHRRSARRFVEWLSRATLPIGSVDDATLERFARDGCDDGQRRSRSKTAWRGHVRRVAGFVGHLRRRGVVPPRSASVRDEDDFIDFRAWLRVNRGITESAINRHVDLVARLRQTLGVDPGRYDAAAINRAIVERIDESSRHGVQSMCMALRMYLRHLTSIGACPPGLLGAVPRVPRWRLATLPKYILHDDVEKLIASCDLATARGVRDRAILLLLARLALRAGDVVGLHLDDIDWDGGLVRVAGKTRHAVALPLPQDVGDALLAYIETARPATNSLKVFMRVIAPVEPLASATAITIVVRDALKRAKVDSPNLRGAYLLRHSAATNLLRDGATLDAVGALLRHRSPDTTSIYAKVDRRMLLEVAQPWIGGDQ